MVVHTRRDPQTVKGLVMVLHRVEQEDLLLFSKTTGYSIFISPSYNLYTICVIDISVSYLAYCSTVRWWSIKWPGK